MPPKPIQGKQSNEPPSKDELQTSPAERDQAKNFYQNSGRAAFLQELVDDDINHATRNRYDVLQKLFGAQSRNLKLSFLQEKDIDFLESLFHDSKLNHMMSQPSYEYGFDDQHAFNQARMLLRASIRRGIGGSKDQMNERLALTTNMQLQDQRQSLETNTPGMIGRIKQAVTGNNQNRRR